MPKTYKFSVDIIPEEDGAGFYVIVPALPGCFSQGKTVEDAKKNVEKAISLHIESLIQEGSTVPSEGTSFQTVIEVAA